VELGAPAILAPLAVAAGVAIVVMALDVRGWVEPVIVAA
jgi:hypothetical protein